MIDEERDEVAVAGGGGAGDGGCAGGVGDIGSHACGDEVAEDGFAAIGGGAEEVVDGEGVA